MRRSSAYWFRLAVAASTCFVAGCAGPDFHYDSGPAPEWTRKVEIEKGAASRNIRAVGTTPATTQPAADLDRARRSALAELAQMVRSRVQSQLTTWSVEEARGDSVRSNVGSYHRINVTAEVNVEDYRVESSHRDEETQSVYVLVSVNAAAWVGKLRSRSEAKIELVQKHMETAAGALDRGRALQAYGDILEAWRAQAEMLEDVAVVEVLAPSQGLGKRVAQLRTGLADVSRRLTDTTRIQVEVACSDPDAARICEVGITEMLTSRGFQVGGSGTGVLRIAIRLGSRYLRSETVANRVEHIAAAEGELTVTEPDGTPVGNLAVNLPPGRHTERAPGQEAALREAVRTAANRIQDGFRSRFRLAYPVPE